MGDGVPRLTGVLETVLYVTDQTRAESFYGGLLGMRLIHRQPGRSLFYRAGDSVFLLFCADATLEGGSLPPHGARGSIHTCFLVEPDDYERWKRHLEEGDVEILEEVRWKRGLSFYFHDPDGNLLEIANADIWPRDPGEQGVRP
jgi:catechol 2,3-dioxygenase-like lactoylglutathione lyase family enzyme